MLSSYRALFGRAGVRLITLACGLAWLSFAGYTFAIILAVHAATGSFAAAGGAAAAFGVGSGLAAPARGRLIDRRGAGGLALFTVIHGLSMVALIAGCALGGGEELLFLCAGLAGLFAPPLMATARSLWTRIAGPELAPTAHALNAALADGAVLLSPPLVGALSGLVSAYAAVAVLLGGATVAGGLITWSGSRVGRPVAPPRRRGSHRVWGVLHESAGLRTLVACDALIGGWIGAFEVAATAVAARSGAPALAALPLSASAAGSLVVSVWSGSARVRQPASRRYLRGCIVVALAFPLMLLAPSVPGLAVVAVAVGAGFALLNVAAFQLLDFVVAADRAVEAFTWLTTGSAVGMALGAASAGQLTRAGELAALGLASCCAMAAAVVAGARRRTLVDPRA